MNALEIFGLIFFLLIVGGCALYLSKCLTIEFDVSKGDK